MASVIMPSASIDGCHIKASDTNEKKKRRADEIKKSQTSHILGLGINVGKSKENICLKEDSRVLENLIVTNYEKDITCLSKNLMHTSTTEEKRVIQVINKYFFLL
jgi:hypothetical protein